MVVPTPNSYPRLIDLPSSAEDRVVALECAGLIAPSGPIPLQNVTHLMFGTLNRGVLTAHAPTIIVMPLFAGQHDALSMVETLEHFGYRGRIFVIAPPLPRPALVERELRAAGPGDRLMLVSP